MDLTQVLQAGAPERQAPPAWLWLGNPGYLRDEISYPCDVYKGIIRNTANMKIFENKAVNFRIPSKQAVIFFGSQAAYL